MRDAGPVRVVGNVVLGVAVVLLTAASSRAQSPKNVGVDEALEPLLSEPSIPGAVCGPTAEWRDAKCYEPSYPVEYENSRAVARVLYQGQPFCLAFKVSDSGQFIMGKRCTGMTNGFNIEDVVLLLDYQTTACDSGAVTSSGSLRGAHMLAVDPDLDFVLFDTIGNASSIPCLQLDQRMPDAGEPIYIVSQPDMGGTKISIESDQDDSGVCRVLEAPVDGYPIDDNRRQLEISHKCDTWHGRGSDGAPVISDVTQRVVAIQHFGYCSAPPYGIGYNTAARMDLIYPRIASMLGTCSNGTSCAPNQGKCNCDGKCKRRESRFVHRGGVCPDCP